MKHQLKIRGVKKSGSYEVVVENDSVSLKPLDDYARRHKGKLCSLINQDSELRRDVLRGEVGTVFVRQEGFEVRKKRFTQVVFDVDNGPEKARYETCVERVISYEQKPDGGWRVRNGYRLIYVDPLNARGEVFVTAVKQHLRHDPDLLRRAFESDEGDIVVLDTSWNMRFSCNMA